MLERETQQGKGSTGKSMGGVRAQFSTPVNIQMSLYAIPFYASFDERLGHPAGYRPQGYLFCATNDGHLAYLRANYEKQVALGLKDVRIVTADEIRGMFPLLRGDDIVGGSFCASDGFVDPYSAMNGFMSWAAERGAKLWKNASVTGIRRDGRGICEVETSRGPVATRVVVNCAGAWAAAVAKMVDVDLPVEPLRRMLVPTEPFNQFPHSAPMIIDMSNGFHFRPEVAGISAGVERSGRNAGIQDGLRADIHRENLDEGGGSRALLREPGGESEASLGGAVRDDAGSSSDPGAGGGSPGIFSG